MEMLWKKIMVVGWLITLITLSSCCRQQNLSSADKPPLVYTLHLTLAGSDNNLAHLLDVLHKYKVPLRISQSDYTRSPFDIPIISLDITYYQVAVQDITEIKELLSACPGVKEVTLESGS